MYEVKHSFTCLWNQYLGFKSIVIKNKSPRKGIQERKPVSAFRRNSVCVAGTSRIIKLTPREGRTTDSTAQCLAQEPEQLPVVGSSESCGAPSCSLGALLSLAFIWRTQPLSHVCPVSLARIHFLLLPSTTAVPSIPDRLRVSQVSHCIEKKKSAFLSFTLMGMD